MGQQLLNIIIPDSGGYRDAGWGCSINFVNSCGKTVRVIVEEYEPHDNPLGEDTGQWVPDDSWTGDIDEPEKPDYLPKGFL